MDSNVDSSLDPSRLAVAVSYLQRKFPTQTTKAITDPDDLQTLKMKQFVNSIRGFVTGTASGPLLGQPSGKAQPFGKLEHSSELQSTSKGKKRVRFNLPDKPQPAADLEKDRQSSETANQTYKTKGFQDNHPGNHLSSRQPFLLLQPTALNQQPPAPAWCAATSWLYHDVMAHVWRGDWEAIAPLRPCEAASISDKQYYHEWQEIMAGLGVAFAICKLKAYDRYFRDHLRLMTRGTKRNQAVVPEVRLAMSDFEEHLNIALDDINCSNELSIEDIVADVWEWTTQGEELVRNLRQFEREIYLGIERAKWMLGVIGKVRETIYELKTVKAQRCSQANSCRTVGAPRNNADSYSFDQGFIAILSCGLSIIESDIHAFISMEERHAQRISDLQDLEEHLDMVAGSSDETPDSLPDENAIYLENLDTEGDWNMDGDWLAAVADKKEKLVDKSLDWVTRLSNEVNAICDNYDTYNKTAQNSVVQLGQMFQGSGPQT